MKTKNEYLKEQGINLETDFSIGTYTKIRFAMEQHAIDYHKSEVEKLNLHIVTHSTFDDEMVTILKPNYRAKDGTIKPAIQITNTTTNTTKYLARKDDLYCG